MFSLKSTLKKFNVFNSLLNYIYILLDSFRVGNVLTMPTSVLSDWILKGVILSWQSFLGVAIIIIGFLGMLVSTFWERRMNEVEKVEEADERTDLLSNAKKNYCQLYFRSPKNQLKIKTVSFPYLVKVYFGGHGFFKI